MLTKNRMGILAKMCGSMTDHQTRINLLSQLNFILNYIRFLPNRSSNLNSYFILIKFQRPVIYAVPFLFTNGCSRPAGHVKQSQDRNKQMHGIHFQPFHSSPHSEQRMGLYTVFSLYVQDKGTF